MREKKRRINIGLNESDAVTYFIQKFTQKVYEKSIAGTNMAISFYSFNDIVLFSRRKVSGHWRADGMLPFLTIWMVMSPARQDSESVTFTTEKVRPSCWTIL